MENSRSTPPPQEVAVIEPDVVKQMRQLAALKWGAKAIARELGISRNTVRRYLRLGSAAEMQERPQARCLDEKARAEAERLFAAEAEGNAVVVKNLLAEREIHASVRTVQRAVAHKRREQRAAQVATVRVETAPGQQMQIDFGQKRVRIGGALVRVYLLVAVLSFSRRLFVKAFLSERQDDWREGIGGAFRHFGGVTRTVLGDNAAALVLGRDRALGTVTFHPAYVAFLHDFGAEPRACRPYRARTKGKTENGVKYVKRNGLAGREFESFAGLETHLAEWMLEADARVHGTTYERPIDRFEREREHLLPIPARAVPLRERRLKRRVANDALVDVDTVRYSVPHRLVREYVEVLVAEERVRIFHGAELVAEHRRGTEPHRSIVEPAHYEGLWKPAPHLSLVASAEGTAPSPLEQMGRSLADYELLVGGMR
jgi:transposase